MAGRCLVETSSDQLNRGLNQIHGIKEKNGKSNTFYLASIVLFTALKHFTYSVRSYITEKPAYSHVSIKMLQGWAKISNHQQNKAWIIWPFNSISL